MATRETTWAVRNRQLQRCVRQTNGRSYTHTCTLAVFEEVAWYIQDHPQTGVSSNDLWKRFPNLPFTQIHVALAFLTHLGCVQRTGKKSYAASKTLYEDAMEGFYYLAEDGN
jgi:hypothetical protein